MFSRTRKGTEMFANTRGPVNAAWASWAVGITVTVVLMLVGLLAWYAPKVEAAEGGSGVASAKVVAAQVADNR